MVTTKAKAKLLNDVPTTTIIDNLCTEKHSSSSRSNAEFVPDYAFS